MDPEIKENLYIIKVMVRPRYDSYEGDCLPDDTTTLLTLRNLCSFDMDL